MDGLFMDQKRKRKSRGKPLLGEGLEDTRIDRHVLFDADVLSDMLALAPRHYTQLSGAVNKACREWIKAEKRRAKGEAA